MTTLVTPTTEQTQPTEQAEPATDGSHCDHALAWRVAGDVPDPELPVVTIGDLGILRDLTVDDRGRVHVRITPTYSGCPAMETIRTGIVEALTVAGFWHVDVEFVLAPAWSTDEISERGRARLRAHGIAPPGASRVDDGPVALALSVRCPRCGSPETRELSHFGATACKALWTCRACREPFEHVKAI